MFYYPDYIRDFIPCNYITMQTAAELLGVSRRAVEHRVRTGRAPGLVMLCGHYYFDKTQCNRELWQIRRKIK
jgi:predicted site-specific integrase-resolvase